MVYEVKQGEVTQEQWDEMKKIARENVCPECGADLQIHTNPEKGTIEVGCLNREHHGYIERTTWTQEFRRGAGVPLVIQAAIEKKMMPKNDLGRAMNLLALRYPRAIENPESAALFIMDCARLDIDPLISPAEAVPVPFKSKRKGDEPERVTVQMVITEDGWLSMAARGCQEEWNGPPKAMRLEEYLTTLKENEGKPRDEILTIAREIKKSECKDEEAWYYVAIGRSKSMNQDTVIPGYFTHKDLKKAEDGHLPAADNPGNQARVRAIKKWIRHVYPECRQKMIELTAEWYQRSEGIKGAQEFIDTEYRILSMPEGDEKTGEPPELKLGEGEVGKTVLAPAKATKTRKASAQPVDEQEGFSIDPTWLKESLNQLKWTDDTCKTFLVSQYKVSPQGSLEDVLKRLTREQAEEFVKQINSRLEKQTSLF